jgi:hypothetical protein
VTHILEIGGSNEHDTQGSLEKNEVLTQQGNAALTNPTDDQTKAQAEALIKKGEEKTPSTPDKSATRTTGQQPSIDIGNPIKLVTPLQSSSGNPNAEVVFIEDLTPISVEEMPPSDFFYNKKRGGL